MIVNVFCKRFLTGLFLFLLPVFLYAQSQYDYMDDDAVAGGVDRALNGIIFIVCLVVIAIVLILVFGGLLNIYYWFNPQANPDYKRAKRIEEKKKQEDNIIAQKRKDAVPEAVDLGLSVKWASFNLGAYKPSDIGDTFHWGEIHPSTSRQIRKDKFNANAIGDISGNPEYDAAINCLGKNWRMPTVEECRELIECCTWEAKIIDGVEGRLVTGSTGHSIFIPFNQLSYSTKKLYSGNYWTSSPSFNSRMNDSAQDIRFGEGIKFPADLWNAATASACLFGIRPVYDTSRKKTKEENRKEIMNAFSQITSVGTDKYNSLYDIYEEKCIVREDEKKKLFDSNKTYEENTFIDEYGVVYSVDGKRLLYGGDCSCDNYFIKEGTEFICTGAFNNSTRSFPYMFPKKSTLKKITLPSSLIYLNPSGVCDNCEIESMSPYYSIIDKLLIDNRKKSIVKCLDKFANEVVIGEPIEEIGEKAFINCEVLREVVLPNTIKRICKNAFRNNGMLESINLTDSIEAIEEDAFFYCKSLHINKLPDNLVQIGNSAFSWCNMNGVIIPNSIKYIGNAPFPKNCTNLQSCSERFVIENSLLIDKLSKTIIQLIDSSVSYISIPKYLTTISPNAFHHCDIESINIPSNIVEIGSWAFGGCKKLKEITFDGPLPCIPRIAFTFCESLTTISLPHGVRVIEPGAFERCKNLKDVVLNDDLKVISNNAFTECPNLFSLRIPESVEIMGEDYGNCFRDCPNLHELYYDAKNAIIKGMPTSITKLIIGEHVQTLPTNLIPSGTNIEEITIPENVCKVSTGCIWGNVKEVTILSKDIILEDGWMKNCQKLTKVSIQAETYEALLPHLPQKNGLKISKIYPHHFLFFKW